ncbi:hypothetical protein T10_10987 [Trichinella papuae]|uniref:Uncharacterized protein n=1 Tax=Trichinella papuae TaxID=268474 RepID=A0A0V1M9D8_9BILA|nr:hypothetical protein T10_10987 [Trichinella papuae]
MPWFYQENLYDQTKLFHYLCAAAVAVAAVVTFSCSILNIITNNNLQQFSPLSSPPAGRTNHGLLIR